MCLQIYTRNTIVDDVEMNPWFKNGIDESDIILGKALGLLEDSKDIEPFDKMVENEEEYLVDLNDFLDEMERLEPNYYVKAECTKPKGDYKNIPVRIVKIFPNWALGSIDGNKCVYVPSTLLSKVSTGAIYNMTLIHTPFNNNPYKAIYVEPKVNPVHTGGVNHIDELKDNELCDYLLGYKKDKICEYVRMKQFHIPHVDIGKTVGKNGFNIEKVIKDYIYNNQHYCSVAFDVNDDMKDVEIFPQFNFTDMGDYTVVEMWYNRFLDKLRECEAFTFNPELDVLQKLYV